MFCHVQSFPISNPQSSIKNPKSSISVHRPSSNVYYSLMYNIANSMRKRSEKTTSRRHEVLATGQVVPESTRCVQCGICSFNCPIGIDVRRYAWLGKEVNDSYCLTCGECIQRCPRAVLRFERTQLFKQGDQ
jgi:heterodisulfide reductase subunit C